MFRGGLEILYSLLFQIHPPTRKAGGFLRIADTASWPFLTILGSHPLRILSPSGRSEISTLELLEIYLTSLQIGGYPCL